jgi:CubicO group peptidase (beta-lactamase class C family)
MPYLQVSTQVQDSCAVEPIAGIAARLEARAAGYVKDNRLPGAAAGVVHGDALAWSAGVGLADIASRRPPDDTTLYRVASITKTFTGTAIMRLRDEGKLDLDDPIGKHVPEVGHLEGVTIRRLLSHESGLQSEPPDTDWRKVRYEGSTAKNLARAVELGTRVPPNTQHKYSNLGFQLLGEVVTRRSGTPYVDHVRQTILDPLGMSHSGFEPLPPDLAARRATGYGGRFVSDELSESATAPTVYAEGGLWSCVEDLARWISHQFRDDPTLREMQTPRYLVDEAWTEAFGLAWYAIRRGDVVWVQHSGALHGFRSNVCFDPKQRVGAIVLFNGVGDAATLAMDLAEIAREAVAAAPPRIVAPAPTPEGYRDLLGIYFDPDLGLTRRVEWRDGKLTIIDPALVAWRPTLAPTDVPDLFLIEPGVRESGENAVFNRLPDGRVASIFIAAGTWQRMDPVTSAERVTKR